MIRVNDLVKRFGSTTVLKGLSFDVRAGEAVALWGTNGAGKTTALKCLLGLYRFEGQAVVAGHDVAREGKAARAALGYVPQELALYDLSTLETVQFYAELKRSPAQQVNDVLALVGLADQASKPAEKLSGGMKQRLALGCALLGDPPVLLLDEPTSNLDAAGREAFMHLLARLKESGKTILFSSHRLEELEAVADRVLIVQEGRLAFECAPQEVAERLGLTLRLKLHLPADQHPLALEALASEGYAASPNGRGIWVTVAPSAKAAPIRALEQAGIAVTDFDVTSSGSGRHDDS
jgi:ABC-type multidrug transport system ATPase subunit